MTFAEWIHTLLCSALLGTIIVGSLVSIYLMLNAATKQQNNDQDHKD